MRVVELAQGLGDDAGMHGDGAVRFVAINKISHQGFDIAVENEADDFRVAIDNGRAGIPAGDVICGDEVNGRGQIQFVASSRVARRKEERPLKR